MSEFGAIDDKPKRFYKEAGVAEVENGWSITLDGRPIKTPEKQVLAAPTRALAEVIAAEWAMQGEHLEIADMHVTRLANVAFDRTAKVRAEMAEEAARYAETDLVCHVADGPADLVQQQDTHWGPIRDWAGEMHGVVLVPASGVMAMRQPDASLQAVRDYALSLDDWKLTGLNYGLGLLGSVVLAMALAEGRLSADDAFAASRIDEAYQLSKWGDDEEAVQAAARRHVEVLALESYFLALAAA